MAQLYDQNMEIKAINYFISLIRFKKSENKSCRPTDFAGNIGRHMGPELKTWFLAKYPESSHFYEFFMTKPSVFVYDPISGKVDIKTGFEQPFETPNRLKQLEDMCADPSISLHQLSRYVSEVELFLVSLKWFVNINRFFQSTEPSINKLAEVFIDHRYDNMFAQIQAFGPKSNDKNWFKEFESNLISYLTHNYDNVFDVSKHGMYATIKRSVMTDVKKVWAVIDDSVYPVFASLVAKYLGKMGSKEIGLLLKSISKRHPFIVEHMFGPNNTNEFTFYDFINTNRQTFTVDSIVAPNGQVFRKISLRTDDSSDYKTIPMDSKNSADELHMKDQNKANGDIRRFVRSGHLLNGLGSYSNSENELSPTVCSSGSNNWTENRNKMTINEKFSFINQLLDQIRLELGLDAQEVETDVISEDNTSNDFGSV